MTRIETERLLAQARNQAKTRGHAGMADAANKSLPSSSGFPAAPPSTSKSVHLANPASCATESTPALLNSIAALDPDDPQRRRKAFRHYLENLLLRELGFGLINGHDFGPFVDEVLSRMESLPELATSIDAAATFLLTNAAEDARRNGHQPG